MIPITSKILLLIIIPQNLIFFYVPNDDFSIKSCSGKDDSTSREFQHRIK